MERGERTAYEEYESVRDRMVKVLSLAHFDMNELNPLIIIADHSAKYLGREFTAV